MSSPSQDVAPMAADSPEEQQAAVKRKRNLPGTPDPEAEVIALSPKTLMATNRFLCEVCGKGFQRDQNLQLHRRGHNLPWKLKQRDGQEVKRRVYVCPEASCIHHDPSRALGDLTGIKKHFSRKHGEKKWKCEKCSKRYAVHSDWKAHQKVCGTREYRCDCGTLFSRRDSFITHRAFCDALAQENAKASAHRHVEAQQSSDTAGNITSAAGDLSSAMEASASPFQQQATSEKPKSDIVDPLGRDMWEVNSAVNDRRLARGLQGGLALLPSMTTLCPGLSLSLGTGLGPGPPHPSEMMGSLPQTMALPSPHQMKSLACINPDRDNRIQWPSPLASAGIFTSLLTAANSDSELQGCGKESHGRNGMAGLSIGITESSMLPRFASSSYLNNGLYPSKRLLQHTGSAQLPATTLLQRAAIMGVTKSDSFLNRNSGDISSSTSVAGQHDSWAGVTTSLSNSWLCSSLQPMAEGLHLSYGPGYGVMSAAGSSSTSCGGHERAQESRDPSGAPHLEETLNPASSSSMTGLFLLDGNQDNKKVGHFDPVQEGSRLHNHRTDACVEVEGSQRVNTTENNRMTLDFLGIGDHSPSQEDVRGRSLLSADERPEFFPFRNTVDTKSEGER